ncbi:MAG: TonB-dependent receptor [Bryobacteraceae bacterium]|nr:TonB-dependent receptor [Bryobacteraceae bacterium]
MKILLAVLLSSAVFTATLRAQKVTATVVGVVSDPSGAAIAEALISARNTGTNATKSARTDVSGNYSLTYLPPGTYEITAEAPGFKRTRSSALELQVDQTGRVDLKMEVGAVTESVLVEASAPLVSSETSSVGQVITSNQIVSLPLRGRTFFELAQLAPGVLPRSPSSFVANRRPMPGGLNAPAFHVSGARESSNGYIIDGVNAQDPHYLTPSIFPSVDAIQEFKLQTSTYSAEFGRYAAQINATTRSGTNQFHGVLYEFFRNEKLDAANFFDNFAGREQPPLRYNQFGATLGGPLGIPKLWSGRDRTFFFLNYEGTRVRNGRTAQISVPTAEQRNGDLSRLGFRNNRPIYDPATTRPNPAGTGVIRDPFPDNRIPATRITPFARTVLGLFPLPNSDVATGNNYFTTLSDVSDNNQGMARIDHRISDRMNLFYRYSVFDGIESAPSPIIQGGRSTDVRTHNMAFNLVTVWTPKLLHELRMGYNRPVYLILQQGASETDYARDLGLRNLLADPVGWGVPQVSLTGFSGIGSNENPTTQVSNVYQLVNHVSYTTGAHSLKFGTDFRKTNYNDRSERSVRGAFGFTGALTADPTRAAATGVSLADLLLGLPLTATGSNTSLAGNFNGFSYAFFAQDDWRVNSRLTFNLGVRYDLNTRYTDVQNRMTLFDAAEPGGRILIAGSSDAFIPGRGRVAGTETSRGLLPPDKNNWAPRIGFALRPFGNSGTVVRGGYGLFFETVELQDLRTFVRNPPFGAVTDLRAEANANSNSAAALRVAELFPAEGTPAARPSVFSPSGTYSDPYYQQWNFGVEHEVFRSTVLEVSYIGSKGTNLVQRLNLNQARLDADPGRPTTVLSRQPFPTFGTIRVSENAANSSYHAMIVRFERRLNRGLSFLSSYTFGKSLDFGSLIDDQPRDIFNRGLSKGRSDYDVRHRVVLSGTWEVPGRGLPSSVSWLTRGWQINGIFSARTGFPLTVNALGDICNCAAADQTAQQVGDPSSGEVGRRERWFNTSAFVNPAPGTFGSSGRNILDGPGEWSINSSLFRSFTLNERMRLQFRAESFNLTNHTNFGLPNAQVGNPNYGVIQGAADARTVQFALKLVY